MNKDPKTGGKMGGGTVPWDVMQIPMDNSILWAGKTADVRGLAVGDDGLVVLHHDSVEGISADGRSLWTVPLPVAAGAVGRGTHRQRMRRDAVGRTGGLLGAGGGGLARSGEGLVDAAGYVSARSNKTGSDVQNSILAVG